MPSALKVASIYSSTYAQNSYGQASYGRLDKNGDRAGARGHGKDTSNDRRFFKDVLKEEISKRAKR